MYVFVTFDATLAFHGSFLDQLILNYWELWFWKAHRKWGTNMCPFLSIYPALVFPTAFH